MISDEACLTGEDPEKLCCSPSRTFSPEKNDKSENPKEIVNFSIFLVFKYSKSKGTFC